jgi:hypothetical protein
MAADAASYRSPNYDFTFQFWRHLLALRTDPVTIHSGLYFIIKFRFTCLPVQHYRIGIGITKSSQSGYDLNDMGSIPGRAGTFLFTTMSRPASGSIQLPIQYQFFSFQRINRTELDSDHSSSSAEHENAWTYISIRPYIFVA